MGGCTGHDRSSAIIQRTIDELRANAESWDTYNTEEARSYLAPAFRRAIPLLEKDGTDALPLMLTAAFRRRHFDRPENNVTEWSYVFCWLDMNDEVRGFYLRSKGQPDVDLHPALFKEPQVEGTAWMMDGGPIAVNEDERSRVPTPLRGRSIVLDARVLEREDLLVGLILADGRKTAPVRAYVGQLQQATGTARSPSRVGEKAQTDK
jgi:hypothetical protein